MQGLPDCKKRIVHSSSMLSRKRMKLRFITITGILLFGILCGSIWQHSSLQNTYLSYFAQQYLQSCLSGSFLSVASSAFLSHVLLEIVVLFFSFSCIGAPVLFCIPALYGISIGGITAYLYTSFGMRGLLANMILFLIPHILSACSLLVFVDSAICASSALYKLNIKGNSSGTNSKMRLCFNRFIITLCGMLISSLLEGILCAIFAPILLK